MGISTTEKRISHVKNYDKFSGVWDNQSAAGTALALSSEMNKWHRLFLLKHELSRLFLLVSCLYVINNLKIIHGYWEVWNFSSIVQLDVSRMSATNESDIELNTRREIPYLRAPMFCYLYTWNVLELRIETKVYPTSTPKDQLLGSLVANQGAEF